MIKEMSEFRFFFFFFFCFLKRIYLGKLMTKSWVLMKKKKKLAANT